MCSTTLGSVSDVTTPISKVGRGCVGGMRCPQCDNKERFHITGYTVFDVTEDGYEASGDHEWDGSNACSCPYCKEQGDVNHFTPPLERCGECEACQYVQDSKPMYTPLPYSGYHADDALVTNWNAIIKNNPCKEWEKVYE